MRDYFKNRQGHDELESTDISPLLISGKDINTIIEELQTEYGIVIKEQDIFLLMMYLEDKYNVHFKTYKSYKVL
jgi:hypothetical protein